MGFTEVGDWEICFLQQTVQCELPNTVVEVAVCLEQIVVGMSIMNFAMTFFLAPCEISLGFVYLDISYHITLLS